MLQPIDVGAMCLDLAAEVAAILLEEQSLCRCRPQELELTFRLLPIVLVHKTELGCACDKCINVVADYVDSRVADEMSSICHGLHLPSCCGVRHD